MQQRARTNTRVLTNDLITQMRGKIHTNGCSLFVQNASNTHLVLRTRRNYVCLVCGKWQYLYVYDTLQQFIMSKSKLVVVGPLLGQMFRLIYQFGLLLGKMFPPIYQSYCPCGDQETMYEYANYSHILLKYCSLNLTFIITRSINVQHGSYIFSIIIY